MRRWTGLGMTWIAIGALVAACAVPPRPPSPQFVFVCPAGDTVRVQFLNDSAAVLLPRDATPHLLPRAISGSGARYSDGTLTFWNKGDSAFVMRGDSIVIQDCGITRQRS
ncbi:MAG TPA: MliC family protein [Gemmatimonadales bacterium]|nr:MliC family protein [Gemmatimonadales bacterium]